MEKAFHSEALNGLCSKDQLDLLNSIDLLRSQGISHYVSLPQIIVCGDQSSGKSSVLEAISGVSFPIKSNLCTRFPTELVLRKTSHIGVSVSIVPHESRSESERLALGGFQENLDGFDGLPTLIENAKAAMAISTHGRAFSKDLLRVEVSGPDRPHLTIVDLPGLIHSQTKQQSASDVELVQDVVQDYMKEPRSIILAVVSAKNDYANQIVLKLARAADREGNRTLGVVTKPDSLVPRSESEAMYVSLARNQDVEFRLGWHVLRNMDSELGECSLLDRDKTEKDFFSKGIWQELSPLILGVEKLRNRLSTVLLGQIAAELPSLIHEIEIKASTCRSKLDMLGKPRATLDEQRAYLLHISQSFQSLVKASVDGTYNDPFFEDAMSDTGYQKRIRAVVQNLNIDFADHIAKRGHCREIVESSEDMVPKGVTATTREEFLDHIQHLMQRTRGRELPGTFNPMIVADLFLEQSTPWEMIARKHVEKAWNAAQDFLNHLVASVADLATSGALFQKIFEPALKQLLDILNTKTIELLTPHQKSHPITYSPYFTEIHHKVRKERNKAEHREILKAFFGVNSLESVYLNERSKDLRPLLTALVDRTEPDLNRFACSEALDCMEAYYKVALKRFVDDIAVEVIEVNLLSMLSGIFSPLSIMSMAEDIVTSIAGELEASRTQREQLTRQLDVLMRGAETCKRFVGIRIQSLEAAINRLGPMNKSTAYDSTDSDNESHSSAHHGVSSLPGSISSEKSELSISNIPSPSIVPVASLKEAPEQSFPSLSSRKPKAIKFQKNTVFV